MSSSLDMISSFVPLRKFVWSLKPPFSALTSLYALLISFSLILSSIFSTQLSVWIRLFLHILWATVRSVSYFTLLDLGGLSVYMLHSSQLQLLCILHQTILYYLVLAGILLCSAASTKTSFNCFHSSCTWVSSSPVRSCLIVSNSFPSCGW